MTVIQLFKHFQEVHHSLPLFFLPFSVNKFPYVVSICHVAVMKSQAVTSPKSSDAFVVVLFNSILIQNVMTR